MSKRLSRRDFLRRCATLGLGGAGAAFLAGCGAPPTPELLRIATTAPTGTATQPATATSRPAATATTPPTSTPPAATAPGVTPVRATATATPLPSATPTTPATPAAPADLIVAHGSDAGAITRAAIAALGGMERFVVPGDNVIVKPNICNAYHGPEYASTTNPEVVAAIVALCLDAGAGRVRVMDYPFGGKPEVAYEVSGIAAAVQAAGGEMELMKDVNYRAMPIPRGQLIHEWPVYGDAQDADLIINVPIAKDHGSTRLTMGMKNLMGLIQRRNGFHAQGLHACIADLNSALRPQLTVVDAVRILTANGPTGGSLNDVRQLDTVIAGTDVVAADAYACTLFGLTGADIDYIRIATEMGLGNKDLDALRIERIDL